MITIEHFRSLTLLRVSYKSIVDKEDHNKCKSLTQKTKRTGFSLSKNLCSWFPVNSSKISQSIHWIRYGDDKVSFKEDIVGQAEQNNGRIKNLQKWSTSERTKWFFNWLLYFQREILGHGKFKEFEQMSHNVSIS